MNRAAFLLLAAVACAEPAERNACQGPAAVTSGPLKVDGTTARLLVANGARLVDVRAPDFFAGGHIEGAINVPWAQVVGRAAEIGPPETEVVLYCRTGEGSEKAAAALARLGYRHVYDLGSYLNWGEGAPAATPLPVR